MNSFNPAREGHMTVPVPIYRSQYHRNLWTFHDTGGGPARVVLIPGNSRFICKGDILQLKNGRTFTPTAVYKYAESREFGFSFGD
jgi:hypothetical protein